MRVFKMLMVAAATLIMAQANAATLNVDGSGRLLGAGGVDVSGTLYDVSFQTGTCAAVFDGCDEDSDFTFQTFAGSGYAAVALLDQVFLDGPQGAFDTMPGLTGPCNDPLACYIFTPNSLFGGFILGFVTENHNEESSDRQQITSTSFGIFQANPVWAVWSQTTAVPLPAAGWFLLVGVAGLFGLGWVRGRQVRS